MCGILGLAVPAGTRIDPRDFREALDTLRHRGPDDEGLYLHDTTAGAGMALGGRDTDIRLAMPALESYRGTPNLALGHRRLAIIDLSPTGHQPMSSADGLCWIVLNGEIYNYRELRSELEARGHRFRSSSDTEVVLAAYGEWGREAIPRLLGMFAMAILDLGRGSILLARDYFGIKPLYYWFGDDGLAFASEIKALTRLRRGPVAADPGRVYDFLRHNLSDYGDATIFRGIGQLPAAHTMELQLDGMRLGPPARFWGMDQSVNGEMGRTEAASKLRSLLEESVSYHLRSDVPVGSCLSGGLDSSAIVAMMRRQLGPSHPLRTFSYIADDRVLSEERYVDLVNRAFGCIPHKGRLSPEGLAKELDELVLVQEIPFMSTSIYAQYKVFQWAKQDGIKVMLDGQGADELFAGYLNLLGARITSQLARGRIGPAWRLWKGVPSNMSGYRHSMLAASLGRLLPGRFQSALMAAGGQPLWPSWSRPEWFVNRGVKPAPRPHGLGRTALRQELVASVLQTSLPNLLRFEDRNSMAHSIESRVPFCNHRLAEFAFSLPEELLIDGSGTTKAVLKESMRGVLPPEVIEREKIGFTVPEKDWATHLRPWIERTLNEASDRDFPMLNLAEARRMILRQIAASDRYTLAEGWRVVMLIKWKDAWGVDFRS